MKNLDASVERGRWLGRPLCRRYAVVEFVNMSCRLGFAEQAPNRTIAWALGALINGDREILGAWKLNEQGAIPAEVFGGLYDRGVEYITYVSGDLAASQLAFTAAYPRAIQLPSVEQSLAAALASIRPVHRPAMSSLFRAAVANRTEPLSDAKSGLSSADWRERYPRILEQWDEAVAAFQPLSALPEPYRLLVRSVDQTAIEVQERVMRAIHRHGPFADVSEAFQFVAVALQRADRQLYRELEARRRSRGTFVLPSGRVAPASVSAVGTPTLAERVLP